MGDTLTLGQKLRAARAEAGLTHAEVGLAVEVARQRVSEWERDMHVPGALTLGKLAQLLGKPACELLGERCPSVRHKGRRAKTTAQ